MSLAIVGHAVVSADGRIAAHDRTMPPELRSGADWRRFQAALDAAALVVLGRLGHEMHVNPGRRRLVVTGRVPALEPVDERVSLWNPAGLPFEGALAELGIAKGTVAVTGGQRVFDLFLPRYTSFDLVTVDGVLLPFGVQCFSGGWPDEVLPRAGLRVAERETLEPGVRLEVWRR